MIIWGILIGVLLSILTLFVVVRFVWAVDGCWA